MKNQEQKIKAGRLLLHPGRFDGCIFDMDGSLVDSMWVWTAIDREFLGRHGYEVPEGFQKDLGGMSLKEMSYYFKKRFSLSASPEEIQEEWNRMAFYKYSHEVPLKPGAKALLRYLKENRIRTGIATSNSRKLAEALLESLCLSDYFHAVVTGDEVKRGKPDPEIYLKACGKMGTRPDRCLVFEDIVPGLEAGIAAGMQVCSVWDRASAGKQAEKEALAHYSIRDFTDIEYVQEQTT